MFFLNILPVGMFMNWGLHDATPNRESGFVSPQHKTSNIRTIVVWGVVRKEALQLGVPCRAQSSSSSPGFVSFVSCSFMLTGLENEDQFSWAEIRMVLLCQQSWKVALKGPALS